MSDHAELKRENAKILRKLAKELDLAQPREIEFAAAFPTREQAQQAADYLNARAQSRALRATVIAAGDDFDCVLRVHMVPDLYDITDIESVLAEATDRFDGFETAWDFPG